MTNHRPAGDRDLPRRQRFHELVPLRELARAEYVAEAEEEWRKRTGRQMTAEELERVLQQYPGDA